MNHPNGKKRRLLACLALCIVIPALFLATRRSLDRLFAYKRDGFPPARSPSLLLELKQYVGLQHFYSQFGQDKWIVGVVFPGVTDGYFVDIGCGDGTLNSNSKALEELGWTGVGADPFPTNWEDRTCQVFAEAVYSSREVVDFRTAETGIDKHLDARENKDDSAPIVKLTTTTIGDLLQRANAPSFIHYISVDTEGSEFEILRVFPFDKYKVGAFTVEHNLEEPKRQRIRELLESHGYRFVQQQMVDDWYVLDDGGQ